MSKISPYTGVAFPQGSKKVAFMAFCQSNRNFVKTRALIKNNKLFEGRTPSLRTLRGWSENDHWSVLADMVDDGILNVLEMEKDPDIREAIRDDATFFRIMLRLRSSILVDMSKKKSNLMPRNPREAVALLKFMQDQIEVYKGRVEQARDRSVPEEEETDIPKNVRSMAKYLKDSGVPVTDENIARSLIRTRKNNA